MSKLEVTVRNYATSEVKVVRGALRTFTASHPFTALIVTAVVAFALGAWVF